MLVFWYLASVIFSVNFLPHKSIRLKYLHFYCLKFRTCFYPFSIFLYLAYLNLFFCSINLFFITLIFYYVNTPIPSSYLFSHIINTLPQWVLISFALHLWNNKFMTLCKHIFGSLCASLHSYHKIHIFYKIFYYKICIL